MHKYLENKWHSQQPAQLYFVVFADWPPLCFIAASTEPGKLAQLLQTTLALLDLWDTPWWSFRGLFLQWSTAEVVDQPCPTDMPVPPVQSLHNPVWPRCSDGATDVLTRAAVVTGVGDAANPAGERLIAARRTSAGDSHVRSLPQMLRLPWAGRLKHDCYWSCLLVDMNPAADVPRVCIIWNFQRADCTDEKC